MEKEFGIFKHPPDNFNHAVQVSACIIQVDHLILALQRGFHSSCSARQKRVLQFFYKRGLFDKKTVEKMHSYENSGFSLDAKVRIESWDRSGLERLIRYCARPPFKSENLRWNGPWLIYRLPKPSYTGQTFIQLGALDFLEKISNFIPYPRRHRRHYHGVLAPNSPMREKVALCAQTRSENMHQKMQEAAEKTSLNLSQTDCKDLRGRSSSL